MYKTLQYGAYVKMSIWESLDNNIYELKCPSRHNYIIIIIIVPHCKIVGPTDR